MTIEPSLPSTPFAVMVNDDPTQLNLLSGLLRKAGLEPRAFTGAEAALADMSAWAATADRDSGALPALVVVDLDMPDIDGWRFCRLLRSPEHAAFSQVPILVVSATFAGDEADRITADLGAEAFLPSPVDGKRFVEKVRAILSGTHVRPPTRVLIVEDSKTQSNITTEAFEANGYQADMALTAREAAHAFAKIAYDVAVLDYHLPDGRGDSLLDAFRAQRPDCVCLMMTTDTGSDLALDWMKRGAVAYLQKPFQPDYLVELCTRARRERAYLRVQDLLEVRIRDLRESKKQLTEIIEFLPDATLAIDMEGRVIIWNRAIEEMTGIPASEMIGKCDHAYTIPFYGEARAQLMDLVLQRNSEIAAWYPNITREGDTLTAEVFCSALYNNKGAWVFAKASPLRDRSGNIVGAIESIRDITERKQAEETLKESQEKLRLLFDKSADGNLILDKGRFIECNESALRIAGFTKKEQLIGLRPTDVSPEYQPDGESSAAKVERMIALAFEKGSYLFEWLRKRFDGSELSLEVLLTAIPSKGQTCLHVSWRDTSARKLAEQALRESEQKYRMLVEKSNEGILVAQDGMFKYGNDASTRIGGYSAQEILSIPFLDLIHPDDRAKVGESYLRRLRGEAVESRYVCRLICKNGKIKWVALGNALITHAGKPAILSVVTDINERVQAEDLLRQSERRLSDIVDFLPDATFAIDTEGTITAWNRAIEKMTGKTKAQMLGRRDYEYAIPFYGCRRPILIDLTFRNSKEIKEKYTFVDKENDALTAEVFTPLLHEGKGAYLWGTATLLRDGNGVICGAIESIRDITERKQAESELDKLQQQLLQAQKMEAIGRLAGGIAHDFNNLLTTILGNIELIRMEKSIHGIVQEVAEEIQKAGLKAAELTRRLLAFSRKQMLQPRTLDLNDLIESLSKMLRRLIGEDITLELRLGAGLGNVKADPGQIEQVILNLAANARDAMPAGGRLILETRNSAANELVQDGQTDIASCPCVLLTVSDTGAGMDETVKAHLFEPFFTTKEYGKGTGLGLSSVYGIVRQSGGHVLADSELGQGTSFTILLPRVGRGGDLEEVPPFECMPSGGTEKILLVEDDPSVLQLVTNMLQSFGYTVIGVGNSEDALSLPVIEGERLANLLVTDIVLPGVKGTELARRMQERSPDLSVLFMSGYTDEETFHEGVRMEKKAFLLKPFTRDALGRKVREVLDCTANSDSI